MMFRRRAELRGLFDLQDVVARGGAVEAGDAVSVSTPVAAWAYAAAVPRRTPTSSPPAEYGPCVVEVDAVVTAGSVGFGCLAADQRTFLTESILYEGDGPVTTLLRLESLEACACLMVRNGDRDGRRSTAVVRAVRVFLVEDVDGQPPFVFDHIYKTGGTTFHHSYLPAAFRPHERYVLLGTMEEIADSRRRLLEMPRADQRRLRVVAGHKAGTLRDWCPDAKFLSLVRDPVSRVVSAFRFARSLPINQEILERPRGRGAVTLREFVETDLLAKARDPYLSVHDWQAATLLGDRLTQIDPTDSGSIADAIAGRFRLVGYTEALELFLFLLHHTEGFPLVVFNDRLVRGSEAVAIAPEDVAAIRRHNAVDEAVYRAVRQAFDRRAAEIWNDEIDRDYRWYRERLESFRRASGGDAGAMRLLRC